MQRSVNTEINVHTRRGAERPRRSFHLRWKCGNADCVRFNLTRLPAVFWMILPPALDHSEKNSKSGLTDFFFFCCCCFSTLVCCRSGSNCSWQLKPSHCAAVTRPLSVTAGHYSPVDIGYWIWMSELGMTSFSLWKISVGEAARTCQLFLSGVFGLTHKKHEKLHTSR